MNNETPSERPVKDFAVMLFENEFNLGISNNPNKWVHLRTLKFKDGFLALEAYANIPNPASQLIRACSEEELEQEIQQMKDNYQNQSWLEENLYPYL